METQQWSVHKMEVTKCEEIECGLNCHQKYFATPFHHCIMHSWSNYISWLITWGKRWLSMHILYGYEHMTYHWWVNGLKDFGHGISAFIFILIGNKNWQHQSAVEMFIARLFSPSSYNKLETRNNCVFGKTVPSVQRVLYECHWEKRMEVSQLKSILLS